MPRNDAGTVKAPTIARSAGRLCSRRSRALDIGRLCSSHTCGVEGGGAGSEALPRWSWRVKCDGEVEVREMVLRAVSSHMWAVRSASRACFDLAITNRLHHPGPPALRYEAHWIRGPTVPSRFVPRPVARTSPPSPECALLETLCGELLRSAGAKEPSFSEACASLSSHCVRRHARLGRPLSTLRFKSS